MIVQSAATAVEAAPNNGGRPRVVILQNRAGGDVYFGLDDTVTADDAATGGFKLVDGDDFGFVLAPGRSVYIIGAVGPVCIIDMEQA